MDVPQVPAPGAGGAPPPVLPRCTQRALAVAADAARREFLVLWLHERGYVVTACSNPVEATAMLRDGRGGFGLVVLDAFPSCVGSLELLRCAISEMRLRVHGRSKSGSFYGPLNMDDLQIVSPPITLQKVVQSKPAEATQHGQTNGSASTTTTVSTSGRRAKRRKKRQLSDTESQEVEQDGEHGDEQRERPKKARLVWTDELHLKFVDAYNKLLPGDAVPKKILKLMNDATLTRENIASHLQKYRLTLKQPEPHPIHSGNPTTNYCRATPPRASFLFSNMSLQQDIYMSHQTASAVYMNCDFNTKTVIRASALSNMQINHPKLHMQEFEAVNMNKERVVSMVYPKDESADRSSVPKEIYIGSQNRDLWISWEHGYLHNVD